MSDGPKSEIEVEVSFYSFFKELAGCAACEVVLPAGSRLGDLVVVLVKRFPKLEAMQKSMLLVVGVEYQNRTYELRDGDEVSLFPPVQGG